MSAPMGAGERLGPYELQAEIGRGGYGTVWRARRIEPYRQDVAVKFLRIGVDSDAIVARFARERQALALMNHPGIARVLDGGRAPDGRPYFVMEFVDGRPITEWCAAGGMGVRERVALMAQVCDAVQHAHAKGMIHRDLKPSNILALRDGDGRAVARVIDFGIAKLVDGSSEPGATMTEAGQLVGTPEYMSPEQADPDGVDVDTRSDVYSLGVVLYELLAGRPPFGGEESGTRSRAMLLRALRTESPAPPSARVPDLARELDWIVLKALRKEPEERYASAAEFARDLRGFLSGGPLLAAPESAVYRFRSYARRNRAQVVAAAVVMAVLLVATGVSLRFAINESRARADADARAAEAKRIASFQARLLGEIDPAWVGAWAIGDVYKRGDAHIRSRYTDPDELKQQRLAFHRPMKVMDKGGVGVEIITKSLLEPMEQGIEREFADLPLARAEFHNMLAGNYIGFGNIDKARRHAELAMSLRADGLGESHPDLAETLMVLARIEQFEGRSDAAEASYRKAAGIRAQAFGPESIESLQTEQELLNLLVTRGNHDEALALGARLIEIADRRFGAADPRFIGLRRDQAVALLAAGRAAEAEPLARAAMQEFAKVVSENGAGTVRSELVLGKCIAGQGRLEEAERLLESLSERMIRVYGAEDSDTLRVRVSLASVRAARDPASVADDELRALDPLLRARFGEMSPDTRWVAAELARRGRPAP